jgi:hypothetical protein
MNYCYSNNGLSWRMVSPSYIAQEGEVLFNTVPSSSELSSAFSQYTITAAAASIKAQIIALEATATPRRLREAVLGTDSGWLGNLNTQITALRAQLS